MIDEVLKTLPDALATDQGQPRTADATLSRNDVDWRVDAMIWYVRARERNYRQQQPGAGRRGMKGLAPA